MKYDERLLWKKLRELTLDAAPWSPEVLLPGELVTVEAWEGQGPYDWPHLIVLHHDDPRASLSGPATLEWLGSDPEYGYYSRTAEIVQKFTAVVIGHFSENHAEARDGNYVLLTKGTISMGHYMRERLSADPITDEDM